VELPKFAYFQGDIIPFEEARVSVLTHALNYGTAAFGGLRGYWNDQSEQLYIFRPYDHFHRLLQSAKLLRMSLDYTPESLTGITIKLLRTEDYRQDVYIRPLVYKADLGIGVRLHNLEDALSIVALPFGLYVKQDTNAHVTISSWRRVDDNAIPARGKISGAYVNSSLIKTDAAQSGFDEALVLTQDGHVSEGSAMNVFIVRDGAIITPPVTENVLEGITRRSVITLAREVLDTPVIERPIDRTEVYICDEIFLTGTAAQITAVTQVDHVPVGDGVMGPITTQLRQLFTDVVRGRNPDFMEWVTPVY